MTDSSSQAILADQKLLNEQLIECILEVAAVSQQHCADLFEIPIDLVWKLMEVARRPDGVDRISDLGTTPAPLWKLSISSHDVRTMAEKTVPMFEPELERYRPIVTRLNQAVLSLLVRYATNPIGAALVCDVASPKLLEEIRTTPCLALFERAGNLGRPLIEAILTSAIVDRCLETEDGVPVCPEVRALVVLTLMTESAFRVVNAELEAARPKRGLAKEKSPVGKTPTEMLKPQDAQLVFKMLSHRVRPSDIAKYLPGAGIKRLQLERVQAQHYPTMKDARDSMLIWPHARRRMMATVIAVKQQGLIRLGLAPVHALVESFEYFFNVYSAFEAMSLTRILRDVYVRLIEGGASFDYCSDCGVGHLALDEHSQPIACPACCLSYLGFLGKKTGLKQGRSPIPAGYREHDASEEMAA